MNALQALACAAVFAMAASGAAGAAGASGTSRPYTLADLDWIEGTWRASQVDASGVHSEAEEHWGAAIGESLRKTGVSADAVTITISHWAPQRCRSLGAGRYALVCNASVRRREMLG